MEEFEFGVDETVDKGLEDFDTKEKDLMSQYEDGMITSNELKWIKREEWANAADHLQSEVWSIAKRNAVNLIDLDISGATPVSAWVKKISGVGGIVTDPTGNIVDLPIKNNYKKGLSNFEYFVAARGARKSFADVALRTADSGYLTRRLHDVAQDIITNSNDCGTNEGIYVAKTDKRSQSYVNRIKGRYSCEDLANPKTGEIIVKIGEPITLEIANKIDEVDEIVQVKVRSPLTCLIAHGICPICYGYDLGTNKLVDLGEAVGTIASQALGEPTTQLTLKSKSDARAGKSDITQGLPRVEELLEARTPKALALLADISGKIKIIDDKKKIIVRVSGKKKVKKQYDFEKPEDIKVINGSKVDIAQLLGTYKKKEHKAEFGGVITIKGRTLILEGIKEVEIEKETDALINLMVKDGDIVKKGTQLTFGSIDPKELAKLRPIYESQRYIIDGVQEVYGIQGLEVDDRHLEIIARQMGRYVHITDSGDNLDYLPGDFVDVLDIKLANKKLEEEGKRLIKSKRVLLGITNSAIRIESFLSAASFEQQVRVLTDAALVGKVDNLRGLKENVIIGRPVPLGDVLKAKIGMLKIEETQHTQSQELVTMDEESNNL